MSITLFLMLESNCLFFMNPHNKAWAGQEWWLKSQKCCYFGVRLRHMVLWCLHVYDVARSLLSSVPLTLYLSVIPPPNPHFSSLKIIWVFFLPFHRAHSRFGRPHSLLSGPVCVCVCGGMCAHVWFKPPCPCLGHDCYILIPYCCCLHVLT